MKAKCPICACKIVEAPVTCDRCGVEYHADCWKYNEGCAIYGCLPAVSSKSTVSHQGKISLPATEVPSTFWLRNSAVFASALIPPSGFILYSQVMYHGFKFPMSEDMLFAALLMYITSLVAYVLEDRGVDSSDRLVVMRIIVSAIVLAWAPLIWFIFVVGSFLAGLRSYLLSKSHVVNPKELCCKA